MSHGIDATFGQIRHTLDAATRILVSCHSPWLQSMTIVDMG